MNSRILKKLCKRAINFKPAFHGLEEARYECDPFVNNTSFDRKHLSRCGCRINPYRYVDLFKGTLCLGCSCGGYEPEWEDKPAYHILLNHYIMEHTSYSEEGYEYDGMSKITPSKLFKYFNI